MLTSLDLLSFKLTGQLPRFDLSSTTILGHLSKPIRKQFCRAHNIRVCLYIAYIACGSASLYIKTLYFFLTVLELSVAATVANIKIRYDAKTPQFAIFGTGVCSTVSPSEL